MKILSFFLQAEDPLEQFEVFGLVCSGLSISIIPETCLFFLILVFLAGRTKESFLVFSPEKTNIRFILNLSFDLVFNLIKENLKIKNILFFPIIYFFLFLILTFNLLGMLPYFYTMTSSIHVTFLLSNLFF
jgi:F-type H+-transporting ATPase subunit a